VNKTIFTIVRLDKTITFAFIEPLNFSLSHAIYSPANNREIPLILRPELPKFEFRPSFLPCSVQKITIHDYAWMAEEIKPLNLRSALSVQFKKTAVN
jgi:hypothetical protein